jgi:4-amino-4-deoxy-L-arabinose transferase-like glycosyltransferase
MIRRHLPCIVILVVYVICIIAANPSGEFPLNDDWSYTRTAFGLSAGNGLKIDPWSAPSLVGQAAYGGLLTKIFAQRFIVLRVSTLVLSFCTLLLLWGILRRTGCRRNLASVLLLAWAFNPIQFSLSFTYMTEIPFIFFVALAVYLYALHLDTGKPLILLLSSAALGYAFLIRQTALLFVMALLCSLLLDARKVIWTRIRQTALTAFVAGLFVAGHFIWSHSGAGTTEALQRKFDLLNHLSARQLIGNSYGVLFYLAFMLMPVLIFLFAYMRRGIQGSSSMLRVGIPALGCAIAAVGIWWFHAGYKPAEYLPASSYHARMPFLLNLLYDTGLGPLTLDPDYFAPPSMPTYPAVWYGITAMVAAGSVVLLALGLLGLIGMFKDKPAEKFRPVLIFAAGSSLLLALFEIVFSHLQEGGLFDRHILIVAFPLLILVGRLSKANTHVKGLAAAVAAIVLLGSFAVAATHDYMQWNRIRWEMGRQLLAKGVDPLSIVGGFEFNAWNNYDTFVARGRTAQVSHWWYDRRDFIITMMPMDGYLIRQTRSYYSWVHQRSIEIYLISDSR